MTRRITKQFKIEQYDSLVKRVDLLSYYLWDTQENRKPDAKVTQGEWTVTGYRLTGANGGYVVTKPRNGCPDVHFLDDISRHYETDCHPNTLDLRICLVRIRAVRNNLFERSA